MDTSTFYATTSAVSFTLLGFWWVVVQFRHEQMTQDAGRRRLAFVVSLHFILPGLMSSRGAAHRRCAASSGG